MLCLVGLGNTGHKYENTRHNVGFFLIDYIVTYYSLAFKLNSAIGAEIAVCSTDIEFVCAKPVGYMNSCGKSVKNIHDSYGCDNIVVVCDDLELRLGQVRLQDGDKSHRGHNGIKSISTHMKHKFMKLRIGIGRPESRDPEIVSEYVLSKFSKHETTEIKEVAENISLNLPLLVSGEHAKFIKGL